MREQFGVGGGDAVLDLSKRPAALHRVVLTAAQASPVRGDLGKQVAVDTVSDLFGERQEAVHEPVNGWNPVAPRPHTRGHLHHRDASIRERVLVRTGDVHGLGVRHARTQHPLGALDHGLFLATTNQTIAAPRLGHHCFEQPPPGP